MSQTEGDILRLLEEMRSDIRSGFEAVDQRFEVVTERLDGIDTRIDGLTYIVTLLAAKFHNIEERLNYLEEISRK